MPFPSALLPTLLTAMSATDMGNEINSTSFSQTKGKTKEDYEKIEKCIKDKNEICLSPYLMGTEKPRLRKLQDDVNHYRDWEKRNVNKLEKYLSKLKGVTQCLLNRKQVPHILTKEKEAYFDGFLRDLKKEMVDLDKLKNKVSWGLFEDEFLFYYTHQQGYFQSLMEGIENSEQELSDINKRNFMGRISDEFKKFVQAAIKYDEGRGCDFGDIRNTFGNLNSVLN